MVDIPVGQCIAEAAVVERVEEDIERRLLTAEVVVVDIVEFVAVDKQWVACQASVPLVGSFGASFRVAQVSGDRQQPADVEAAWLLPAPSEAFLVG